jgi:anti-sigma regulatory factor (Ser/Thr protein kinase)
MPAEVIRDSDPAAGPALLPRWLVVARLVLPGLPEHVSEARRFVARTLGVDPRAEAAVLLTSEVMTNAVTHSRSRLPGGTVAVVVATSPSGLLVTVTDNGSDSTIPMVRYRRGAEHGNGLLLVETLADAWGYLSNPARTTVWFRIRAEKPALAVPGTPVRGLAQRSRYRRETPRPAQRGAPRLAR